MRLDNRSPTAFPILKELYIISGGVHLKVKAIFFVEFSFETFLSVGPCHKL